jgi:hypothetical protein
VDLVLWAETIIYGHGSDDHQNPRKIRVFNRPFPEGFLARRDRECRTLRESLNP